MWQVALSLLQQLSVAPAIVVERNMFAYYKVPLHKLHIPGMPHIDDTSLYYVLQCPPKVNDTIPKPKDMQTCNVVEQYKEMWQQSETTPKSMSYIKPLQATQLQLFKRLQMVPFKIVLRPLPPPMPLQLHWRYKRQRQQDADVAKRQRRAGHSSVQPVALYEQYTPLKYLGTPHGRQKTLKLSADHRKFKRGTRNKGYQHMYHRDESYNDHIFYDELKLDGKFDKYGREMEDY